jgi:hypothetical protein
MEPERPQAIWRMRVVYWTTKPTRPRTHTHAHAHTHTHINMQQDYLLLFRSNNGYVNAPPCYVTRILPVLFVMKVLVGIISMHTSSKDSCFLVARDTTMFARHMQMSQTDHLSQSSVQVRYLASWDSTSLQNTGTVLPSYTASHPRRRLSAHTPPSDREISSIYF